MTRVSMLLRILLVLQILLCAAMAIGESLVPCLACSRGPAAVAFLGLVFYLALALGMKCAGLTPELSGAVLFGTGIHVALVGRMWTQGPFCILCVIAALLSLGMAGAVIALDRRNLGRLAVIGPAIVLMVSSGWSGVLRPPEPKSPTDRIRIQIFTQQDCPYCETLERDLMPEIEKEFGPRITTEVRPADELASVRRTPTLILHGRGAWPSVRVIEGLPTLERLRGAIRDLEVGP